MNAALRWVRRQRGIVADEARYVDDEEVWEYWETYLVDRIRKMWDTVVIVTGDPRVGKSTLAVRLAIGVAKRLGVPFTITGEVAYRLSELLSRIRASNGQDIVVSDEAVLSGAQAQAGMSHDTQILERSLAISGIKGVTLFMLVPSVWTLARAIRERRAALWIHCETRGDATVRVLSHRLRFKGSDSQLPFFPAPAPWFHLHWQPLDGTPIWDEYMRLKMERTNHELEGAVKEAIQFEKKRGITRTPTSNVDGETKADRRRRLKRLWMRGYRQREELTLVRQTGDKGKTKPPNVSDKRQTQSADQREGLTLVRQTTHKRQTNTPKMSDKRQTLSAGRGRGGRKA